MKNKREILAISGSTRKNSSNSSLIHAVAELAKERIDFKAFDGLAEIPHFNPDLDTDNPPINVSNFRAQLKEADGILICTPEYAMGVPGTLKNAIDWTVSSCEFSHKPVALITASLSGQKAHASLLDTLRIIESHIPDESQLLISFVKTKVSSDGKITDTETLEHVKKLIDSLINSIDRIEQE